MTVTIDIQDSNGVTITTLELFDDTFAHMQVEAALRDIPVSEHIVNIIDDCARNIIDDLKEQP